MGQQFDIENEKVTIDKDGIITECDVLFSFDSEDTGKAYIGYTDHSLAANGRTNIYVSAYNPLDSDGTLEDITNPQELALVNEVLMEIDNM